MIVSITITLLCSSLTLFMSIMDRSDNRVIRITSSLVVVMAIFVLATGGLWLWAVAAFMNLAIVCLNNTVTPEVDIC